MIYINNERVENLASKRLADGVGFEPTDACASAVFKTATINRSDTHPRSQKMNLPVLGYTQCQQA